MLRSLLLLSLLAGCAGPQSPAAPAPEDPLLARYPELDQPMPWDPGVHKGVLDNGLTWYVEPNPEPQQRLELWLAVRAGSLQEDDDQLGLAHFVEHMAFNGTRHFPKNELVSYLESIGGRFGAHLNAHTSFEETVYKLQVPTDDPEIVATGYSVLRDWADGMTFDPEEIDKERGVVLEEWRRSRGAAGRARDALIPLTWHGARQAERQPIGTEESLKTFDPDAARRFYRTWYRPDLMAVFVVGDVDPAAAQATIEATFSDLKNPDPEVPRIQYPVPVDDETLYGAYADPEQRYSLVSVMTKIDEVEGQHQDAYRRTWVQRALSAILNERLSALTRAADAPFLQAGVGRGRMSPVVVSDQAFAVVKDGEAERGLRGLLVEVERARRHGVTQGELERAKAGLIAGMKKAFEERKTSSSRSTLQELLRNFTNRETVPGLDYEWGAVQRYVPALTVDEIDAEAARFLGDRGRVVTAVVPEKEGVTPPGEDALRAVVEAVAAMTIDAHEADDDAGPLLPELPEPGAIVSESFDEETQSYEWILSNGLTVVLKPTDWKAGEILFRGRSVGGTSRLEDADYVPASTAVGIANLSGYGDLDTEQIIRWMAGRSLRVSVGLSGTWQGVSGSARPDDLEAAMQVVYARLVQPRFTQEAFDIDLAQRRQWLANRDADPNTALSDEFNLLLWPDDPRARPWTPETLDQMDLARSEAAYRSLLGHWGDGLFTFVGSFDLEAMRPLITRYLATLPTGEPQPFVDRGVRAASGRHEATVQRGLEPKARVRIRMSGDFESTPEHRHALRMMGAWLSMRLREVLREDLGGTYSVGARVSDRFTPHQDYGVTIDFQCDPDRVQELTEAAWAVVKEVRDAPPDPSYAQRIAEQERRSLETNLRRNRFWLGVLAGNRERGEPRSALNHYWSLNSEITPQSLHEAARTWLDLDRVVQVTLIPEEAAAAPR